MKNSNTNKLLLALLISSLLVLSLSGLGKAQTTAGQDYDNVGPSAVSMGSIVPVETFTGQISWSIDGLGVYPGFTGDIQVEKPAGATVKAAFMGVATTGFYDYELAAGDVKIDGSDFVWSIETSSSIFSWNYWGEVTSLVKTKIDAAAAGTIDFTITENEEKTEEIDGEILVVIFDDPNQATINTIVLLFGAQDVTGDTFNIGLAEPLDLSVTTQMDMSLGISYSYQVDGDQYSEVTVNSVRMSTSSGGEDDGTSTNGALMTVGGIGDSNSNPADPYATPTDARSDDELYSLMPFVSEGDDKITVYTLNPSVDDNIFFAGLFLNGAVAVVGEGIVLAPPEATNLVGSPHTVTATVQDDSGAPIVGREVTFRVVAGPHVETEEKVTTDENGKASFTYTGTNLGTDIIQASFINSQGQRVVSNEVTKKWDPIDQVIPEVPLGTVVGLGSMILALSLYFAVPKIRGKKTIP